MGFLSDLFSSSDEHGPPRHVVCPTCSGMPPQKPEGDDTFSSHQLSGCPECRGSGTVVVR